MVGENGVPETPDWSYRPICRHEWTHDRGFPGDRWRECWLCGKQENQPSELHLIRGEN